MHQLEVPFSKGRAVVQHNGEDWEVLNGLVYGIAYGTYAYAVGVELLNTTEFEFSSSTQGVATTTITHSNILTHGVAKDQKFNLEIRINREGAAVATVCRVYINGSFFRQFNVTHTSNWSAGITQTLKGIGRNIYHTNIQGYRESIPVLGNWSIHKLPLINKPGALLPAQTVEEGFQITESNPVLVNLDTTKLNENQVIKNVALSAKARMNRRSPRNTTGGVTPVIGDTALPPVTLAQRITNDMTLTQIRADMYVPDETPLSIQELSDLDVGLDIVINNE